MVSRELREIVLDGPMPDPDFEHSSDSSFFSSDSSLSATATVRDLLEGMGIDYEVEMRRLREEQERTAEAQRQAQQARQQALAREARAQELEDSSARLFRGLGLEPPPLGQPVEPPDPQHDARLRLNLGVQQFLAAYNGDIDFTLAQVMDAMIGYAADRGLSIIEATFRLRTALAAHVEFIDRQTGASTIRDIQDDRTTDSLSSDASTSDVRGREDGNDDVAASRDRRHLPRL